MLFFINLISKDQLYPKMDLINQKHEFFEKIPSKYILT